jgi:hypothetical protein
MALISSYPDYIPVNSEDRWIGTNSTNGSTRNFTAQQIADYLNINGKISISAQMVFKFEENGGAGGDFTGPANAAALTSVTTMQLSITDVSSQNVVAFMNYLVGNNILISEQNNISTFGHYTIDSYTANGAFYTLNLTNIGGNGVLENKAVYDFAVFTLSSQHAPTFVFNQNTPATVWNIQHNLNNFPSITVIDTGDTVVSGEYTYIDNNNVTLTFSAGFAGKAYLN